MGNLSVQRCQNGLVGRSEIRKMPVSRLLGSSDPSRQMRGIAVIGNENPAYWLAILHFEQKLARLRDNHDPMPEFPRGAITIKPVWYALAEHGLTAVPIWDGDAGPDAATLINI